MHPTRPSRVLISLLCVALAMPPAALAQSSAPSASSTGTLAASQLRSSQESTVSDVPANVADGVFGVYGGAESRFANRPGTMCSFRISAMALSARSPHRPSARSASG
jgi:hypothetical protein